MTHKDEDHECPPDEAGVDCEVCGPQTIPANIGLEELQKELEVSLGISSIDLSDLVCVKPKVIMQNTNCPHTNRKHYAKNMCASCYRKSGRCSFAFACPHTNRLLYSKGMCQTCYLSEYHRQRLNATTTSSA